MTGPAVGEPVSEPAAVTADQAARWSPNQQAARARIAQAAARLVARSGIAACTTRAVAEEAGLTKSTVHYYVDDAGELVDLAVLTFLRQFADHVRQHMDAAADGPAAFRALVRTFLPPDLPPEDGTAEPGGTAAPGGETAPGGGGVALGADARLNSLVLWTTYLAHAWPRGAHAEVLTCFETIRALFEDAIGGCGVPDPAERARAVHLYLLGAVQHNIMRPLPPAEIARAVTALSGVPLHQ
ncbi:TetR family transcriptional regulator [Frankia sp. CcI49]|uniref:TetR/AcrR family transcriptional regulator n=1 Tax=unclassified Frankia TaxID=2632575 RepID=UPI0006C9E76D|nr:MULTISPECIES: TetR family transcriptional regulator [unclassified Frankia]KPM56439.1 TetR family transcriptional regulator [Frankia sp. R43]ONH62132.1 TetR family transcriptional regulator [Frankia sp. CcI49]